MLSLNKIGSIIHMIVTNKVKLFPEIILEELIDD